MFRSADASRRRCLQQRIDQAAAELKRLRQNEKVASQQVEQQLRSAAGLRTTSVFVLLRLLGSLGVEEAMLTTVSKLLLPLTLWSPVGKVDGWSWADQMQLLLDRPRVVDQADLVWANRCAPEHRRIMRRAKRLAAESKVFAALLRMNKKGASPKRTRLIRWLREAWTYGDVGTDVLPGRLDELKAARRWIHRFRTVWQVRWGKLPVRGNLTPQEQTAKVDPTIAISEPHLGLIFDVIFGTSNWVPLCSF